MDPSLLGLIPIASKIVSYFNLCASLVIRMDLLVLAEGSELPARKFLESLVALVTWVLPVPVFVINMTGITVVLVIMMVVLVIMITTTTTTSSISPPLKRIEIRLRGRRSCRQLSRQWEQDSQDIKRRLHFVGERGGDFF